MNGEATENNKSDNNGKPHNSIKWCVMSISFELDANRAEVPNFARINEMRMVA